MQVGTTIGPCSIVSGVLLLIKAIVINYNPFNWALSIAVISVGILLIILGWIKAMQLMKNTEDHYNYYRRFREYDP